MRSVLTLALSLAVTPLAVADLNDTGQTRCYDSTGEAPCGAANVGVGGAYPGQDARFGRDAAVAAGRLARSGAGAAGFDFTKLDAHGFPLADQRQAWAFAGDHDAGSESAGNQWSCVRDNATGLVWEVKTHTDPAGLRDRDWTYTWHDAASARNGGRPGLRDSGAGVGSDNCLDSAACDTAQYIAAVNAPPGLCGGTDWRLPSRAELLSIVRQGASRPAIDAAYFPNTVSGYHWASETYTYAFPTLAGRAWAVDFAVGIVKPADKALHNLAVRLVRGGR